MRLFFVAHELIQPAETHMCIHVYWGWEGAYVQMYTIGCSWLDYTSACVGFIWEVVAHVLAPTHTHTLERVPILRRPAWLLCEHMHTVHNVCIVIENFVYTDCTLRYTP